MQESSVALYAVWIERQWEPRGGWSWSEAGEVSAVILLMMVRTSVRDVLLSVSTVYKGRRCVVAACLGLGWYRAPLQECVAEKTHAHHKNQERERY